jgi:hypothetical protein
MAKQKKNFATRTRLQLLPDEPYEMTYWKTKLNSPLNRFLAVIKHWNIFGMNGSVQREV